MNQYNKRLSLTLRSALSITILTISSIGALGNDTTRVEATTLEKELNNLSEEVQKIKRDQLNYSIEKDLLKETYSNNYERINMVITILLGLIGVLGYIGIRDINAIKKEYATELDTLRDVQGEFKKKSNEFDGQRKTYDGEIKKLIEVNEDQNRKLRLLEIKEKVQKLLEEDKSATEALEYIAIGLEINQKDVTLLNAKGRACTRLNQFSEAIKAFQAGLEANPTESMFISNLTEAYLFNNQIQEAKKIIGDHSDLFKKKEDSRLFDFFEVIEIYHGKNESKLKALIKAKLLSANLETTDKLKGWNLTEAKYFIHYQPADNCRIIFNGYIQYLDGKLRGKELLEKLR